MSLGGALNIVGIGPGNDDHVTPAALRAIRESEIVIGYSTYIALVRHHLGGKQVTRTGMTEEITRAQSAVESAASGKIVTLISSGDAGVYGMAGLVFEVLRKIGWKRGQSPEIRLIPGITAANSCASLVGAPLIHDSCRISLSDLLTPWPVIEERIDCAAKGDFVITLYNPASGRRQRQIVEASRIIKKYRPGATPVALIKSAYRRQQNVVLSDLDHFLDFEIGMNTTVIIGSSNTFVYEGFMVTPRGYANKYSIEDGSVHDGQRRAFSLRCEGDIASRAPDSAGEPLPHLKITKIGEVFMKPSTSIFPHDEPPQSPSVPLDSSVGNALAALEIFRSLHEEPESKGEGSTARPSGTHPVLFSSRPGLLGRIAGALIYAHPGGRYFVIGDLKEPCPFEEFGFHEPEDLDGRFSELAILSPERVAKVGLEIAISSRGEDPNPDLEELYERFVIHRNSSISERLLALVKEVSARITLDGRDLVDARWLASTPLPVWSIVREEVLKCL